jgi:AcrR family transcriptional regulator
MAQAKRRRLPAADARLRILDAAERRLIEAGPEGLRLAELAQELGISHPAILHHFGSREELVREVVRRAIGTLNAELIAAFSEAIAGAVLPAETVLDRIAGTLAERGQARLIAWLILSGREPPELDAGLRLARVGEALHASRRARHKDRKLDPHETEFLVQLVAFALLGDALFGERLRKQEGLPSHARASAEFRARLGKLVEGVLDMPPTEPSPKRPSRTARDKK